MAQQSTKTIRTPKNRYPLTLKSLTDVSSIISPLDGATFCHDVSGKMEAGLHRLERGPATSDRSPGKAIAAGLEGVEGNSGAVTAEPDSSAGTSGRSDGAEARRSEVKVRSVAANSGFATAPTNTAPP